MRQIVLYFLLDGFEELLVIFEGNFAFGSCGAALLPRTLLALIVLADRDVVQVGTDQPRIYHFYVQDIAFIVVW